MSEWQDISTALELVELKPFRQIWLSRELLHSAPSAYLCIIDGEQWAQLEHPKGGPLTCVKNRTGKRASAVVRIDGKWHFAFAPRLNPPPKE